MSRQTLIDPAFRPGRAQRMSFEQFLTTDFGEGARVEWVNGEVVHMAPVSNEHADLQSLLNSLIRSFADAQRLGDVRCEPFVMKLGKDLPGRSPDVMFIAAANRSRLKKAALFGPADLVIEVVSPDSRKRDREQKYSEYQQGGVNEYWIIDPAKKIADFFALDASKKFQKIALDADRIFRSRVLPGLWLRVDWLWGSPLPSTVSILRQWGIV
jgi:Uma2 family endonuclease